MKSRLVYIQSSKEDWLAAVQVKYLKKINAFGQFDFEAIKGKSIARGELARKKKLESEILLSKLESSDFNILLDEGGKAFTSSMDFAAGLEKVIEQGRPMSFFIGGAYGLTDEVKTKFNTVWSLSSLTMNHHMAQAMFLEQFYRALTIHRRIPYHNA